MKEGVSMGTLMEFLVSIYFTAYGGVTDYA